MSLRGPRCARHPSQPVVGVCPYCLRDRLAVLAHTEDVKPTEKAGKAAAAATGGGAQHRFSSCHPLPNVAIHRGSDTENACPPSAVKLAPAAANLPECSRSSSSSYRSVRRGSVPCDEDEIVRLSDVSPILQNRKKTLSSLFSEDNDAEAPVAVLATQPRILEEGCTSKIGNDSSGRADGCKGNGLSCIDALNAVQSKLIESEQRRCRHGSFSERVETGPYIFPATEPSKPLSWFSLLFRRGKKKPRPKSVETMATFGEHVSAWEDARTSWDAPRPSSWEQFRFSSFEGPRSSWEPSRPSWEGFMRTFDGESVFSGIDYLNESLTEVREDAELECKGLQDMDTDWGSKSFKRSRKWADKSAVKHKQKVRRKPRMDDRERGSTFISSKTMQLQRDVSTQTSPPRSSDATDIFIEQADYRDGDHVRQPGKASHDLWSKVWSKTFSSSRWGFRNKSQKCVESKDQDTTLATALAMDEVHIDQASQTSGRSSFHESVSTNHQHQHSKVLSHSDTWNTYFSPVQRLGSILQHEQFDDGDKGARSSNITMDTNGLLRFYVTPVRATAMKGCRLNRQRVHGPWL